MLEETRTVYQEALCSYVYSLAAANSQHLV